jgi:hypothetical protein
VQQEAELIGLEQQLLELVGLGLEAHPGHELAAQGAQAQAFQHLAQLREAYFLLEIMGKNQIRWSWNSDGNAKVNTIYGEKDSLHRM